MAAETVEPSAHEEVRGTSIPTRESESGTQDAREREKQMVASVRPPHQRQMSPFFIRDRPEVKRLGVSAKNLRVDDFALLRTLGTGGFGWILCKLPFRV